jgi:hypothetical protein
VQHPISIDATYEFGPVGDYVIDTGSALPTLARGNAGTYWSWPNIAAAPTVGLAHSLGAEDEAHSEEFYAGILLGLAGAVLIAGLQELLSITTHRLALRRSAEQQHGPDGPLPAA